jgi:hypothetical protein
MTSATIFTAAELTTLMAMLVFLLRKRAAQLWLARARH